MARDTQRMRVELNQFDVRMLRAADKLEDFKVPLRRSETYMERSIGNRFRTANWAPLSAATLRIHPHRVGGKPLNDTGLLKFAITSGSANRLTKKKLTITPGLRKANLHHHGGRTSWGTFVPARPFLFFSAVDRDMIQRVFDDYIDDLVREVNNGNR